MRVFMVTLLLSLTACSDHLMVVSGPKGDTGERGEVGPIGAPGSSCMVTSTLNGATITCSDGSTAPISNGADGSPGLNGSDANIQIVQFCPGTTTYPHTFIEVGFCINNQLWAVYSENNGFLVKVPPGMYHSNGHNSTCNFQVGPNCSVIY